MIYPDLYNCNIAVIGLGYVGLPLALQIAKTEKCYKSKILLYRKVIGFDISKERINELKNFNDKTGEYPKELLQNIPRIIYTNNINDLNEVLSGFSLISRAAPASNTIPQALDFEADAVQASFLDPRSTTSSSYKVGFI